MLYLTAREFSVSIFGVNEWMHCMVTLTRIAVVSPYLGVVDGLLQQHFCSII